MMVLQLVKLLCGLVPFVTAQECLVNSCLDLDIIGICTNSTLSHMSCSQDVRAGTSCTSTFHDYAHHCAFEAGTVSASAEDHCTMDTCDDEHPDEPFLLKRCFGGMEYTTNCNEVLRTLQGGAYCQAGAGVRGAAICSYVNGNPPQEQSFDLQDGSNGDQDPEPVSTTTIRTMLVTQGTSTASASCPEFTYEGQIIKYKGPGAPQECL